MSDARRAVLDETFFKPQCVNQICVELTRCYQLISLSTEPMGDRTLQSFSSDRFQRESMVSGMTYTPAFRHKYCLKS